ncbi:MAG: response regulator [Spirochaetales bacterium]|nr:response regulator [Spirochaetales bacterium]
MKKILIVDESKLFRSYLVGKLEDQGFEVVEAKNGLDGSIKMRNEMPDLILMDFFLSRRSSQELLAERAANPNVSKVPVIMISNKISKEQIIQVSRYNIVKFFNKPLKIDAFLNTVSELLNVSVTIDNTPCIIEAHFNDDILFVEIARGLNKEKIELLSFKIRELLELYEVKSPKILVMMSNLEIGPSESEKLEALLNVLKEETGSPNKYIKILTSIEYVNKYVNEHGELKGIGVADSLDKAMDDLIGIKADNIAHDTAAAKLLTKTAPRSNKQESIELRFQQESLAGGRDINIAVVDDDLIIQELVKTVVGEAGWSCSVFENGKLFVDSVKDASDFDVVFLDLVMPEMNGFEVLHNLKQRGIKIPIIIFSALTKKETVAKAVSYGVKSYIIKPIKPDKLFRKATEVLKANF